MKKFLPFLIVISMMAFLFACNEEGSVAYDSTPYQSVTPTYTGGGDESVDVGGGTNGGTPDPDFDADVQLKVVSGKYCSWTSASES